MIGSTNSEDLSTSTMLQPCENSVDTAMVIFSVMSLISYACIKDCHWKLFWVDLSSYQFYHVTYTSSSSCRRSYCSRNHLDIFQAGVEIIVHVNICRSKDSAQMDTISVQTKLGFLRTLFWTMPDAALSVSSSLTAGTVPLG